MLKVFLLLGIRLPKGPGALWKGYFSRGRGQATAHLDLVTGHLKAEGLIVIGVKSVLLDGGFLLSYLFATLQQVDLDIGI
jgi:hypothetical protein